LPLKFVLVSLFIGYQALEKLLRYGVGIGAAVLRGAVVIAGAPLFHFDRLGQHFCGSVIVSTDSAAAIWTSPFRKRIRSASASTWPISMIAVRLNRLARGVKPKSSKWKWKYMYWWTAASSSATDLFSNPMLCSLFTTITSVI